MSGFLSNVGKVFKQVIKSPIFKAVAIAAAIYFTGGLALGAMGSTFAAALPGIASTADFLGIAVGGMEAGTAATVLGAATANAALATAGLGESIGMTAVDAEAAAAGASLNASGTGLLNGAFDAGADVGGAGTGVGSGVVNTGADVTTGTADASAGAGGAAPQDAGALHDIGAPASNAVDGTTGSAGTPSANSLGTTDAGTVPGAQQGSGPTFNETPASGPNSLTTNSTTPTTAWNQAGMTGQNYGADATSMGAPSATPEQSILAKTWAGFKNMDPLTQKMVLQGVSDAGKGALGAISQKSSQDFYNQQKMNDRANVSYKGQAFNLSAVYQKPSIINTGSTGGV